MPAASTSSGWAPRSRASRLPTFRRIAHAIGAFRSPIAPEPDSTMTIPSILKNRAGLVGLGLLLVALIIWFAGPYFAFASAKPLDSAVERLVAILVLVAAYTLYVLFKQMRNARDNQRLADEVRAASGEALHLSKRFDEAIQTLKGRRKGAGLYDLPWYVIIGPPGSGKTTVLVNSGLNFPLAQKFGKEALRGVGGTRSCDWWFTDQAVLLDTAGRYTTQDSNAPKDSAGWTAFLQLLRRYRRHQPINGVIVALSASDLLTLDDAQREQHGRAIRERLDELSAHLRIEFPVYFLVTKCDLIAGFTAFFDDLGEEARTQVWGSTFAMDVTESGLAAESFGPEFDRVLDRMQKRVVPRMQTERDPRRRVADLAFPQQMSLLRPILTDVFKRVFGAWNSTARCCSGVCTSPVVPRKEHPSTDCWVRLRAHSASRARWRLPPPAVARRISLSGCSKMSFFRRRVLPV